MANKAIGTLGTIPQLTVGGQVFTDLTNLIELIGYTTGTQYATMRRTTTTTDTVGSGYQATGSGFQIYACKMYQTVLSGGTTVRFLYGDDDKQFASAAAPTNALYFGGNANLVHLAAAAADSSKEGALRGLTPVNKYTAMQGSGSNVYGYLYGYAT